MADPWTPEDQDVRARYIDGSNHYRAIEMGEQFDRWLAEHDRQVADKATREARSILSSITLPETYPPTPLQSQQIAAALDSLRQASNVASPGGECVGHPHP